MDEFRLFDVAQIESELGKSIPAIRRSRPKSSIDEAREFSGWTIHKLEVLRDAHAIASRHEYVQGFER